AKMADKPETSEYTSIKTRCEHAKEGKQPKHLARFAGSPRKYMPKGLPFELKSYLELIELTGRCMRTDKRGVISPINSPILDRLNIAPENWLKLTTQFTKVFHGAVGRPQKLDNYCASLKIKRRANYKQCEK
ncbi:transposase, partial [Pseudoalteromonas citrea]